MERVYLTRAGYEKLAEELECLRGAERREISLAHLNFVCGCVFYGIIIK